MRITREAGKRSLAILKIEGSVARDSVESLERECSHLRRSADALRLDLVDVVFVDHAAVLALGRLSRSGVEIRCRPGAVASVLEGEGVRLTQDSKGRGDGKL